MLFNSYLFPVFFVGFFLLYLPLPHSLRRIWLLLSSCVFYMVLIPKYILILFFLIGIDYIAALAIERHCGSRRKTILFISILTNIGVLFYFKYFNFFSSQISDVLTHLSIPHQIRLLHLILPVGLSFHTFQSLSYVIEVYFKRQSAEKNIITYALYVMFWPQLVAGPIERPQNLLHQLRKKQIFNSQEIVLGLRLILLGYLKKMVIADRLALYVDSIYKDPTLFSGAPLWIATYFFTIQIYCDFSGYTDIARGVAHLMGIELSQNFKYPYLANSIPDFWRRWHISLSTWFRDYVYIPLGGNRVGALRRNLNIAIVFILSGLWHGANWTFVAWGALHGFYLILYQWFSPLHSRIANSLRLTPKWTEFINRVITFHLVAFAWIFFRADNLKSAFYIIVNLFSKTIYNSEIAYTSLSPRQIFIRLGMIALFLGLELHSQKHSFNSTLSNLRSWQRLGLYYSGIAIVFIMGIFEATKFIYFQF